MPAPCPGTLCPHTCVCRESRAHCIDIETAYMQGCQRLDQAVMVGRDGRSLGQEQRHRAAHSAHSCPSAPGRQ